MHYVHYITHGTKGVTFLYDVLGKFRFVVCELIVSVMFSEPHVERSNSLSNILFVASVKSKEKITASSEMETLILIIQPVAWLIDCLSCK